MLFFSLNQTPLSIEAAIEYFNNNIDRNSLPQDSEYVDGSFSLSSDDVEFIEQHN